MSPERLVADHINKLKPVKLLLLDVDGVLTEGRIVYDDRGVEIKSFNVKDGLGLRLLMEAGIAVGIITGRRSEAVRRRCQDLGITEVYDGVKDKAALLKSICEKLALQPDTVAFMGDDLPDIPIMKLVGVSVAVADARETVRTISDLITSEKGGEGAVREVCETILKSQGLWDKTVERFTGPPVELV